MSPDGPDQIEFEREEAAERDALAQEAREDRADNLKLALLDIANSHLAAMRACEHRARSNQFGFDARPRCIFCGAVMPAEAVAS